MLELVPGAAAAWADVVASVDRSTFDAALVDPAVGRWVAQFQADLGGISEEQRAALLVATGDRAFEVVASAWVVDMATRVDAAIVALTGAAPSWPAGTPGTLWPAIEAFLPVVARLDALDPVTTELVRLRGARANGCRLCCSRRSVDAVAAGADHATFDAVDRYEASELPESQKIALRLVDAMLWTPTAWPVGLAEQVHEHVEPAASIELVLDVARNGANRIAVALGADAPEVTEGVQWFTTDATGELTYGLPEPGS